MKIRLQDGYSYKNLLANVFVVLTILRNGKCSTIDPCAGAQSLWDTRRNSSEDPGACAGICDINIRDDWYRFDASNSPARMPESSVEIWQCGTHIPIWLKGGHPTVDNPGPLTINVCAQLRTGGPICEWQNTISVMRCYDNVEYFIYKLKPTPFCDMAYCAGKGIECPNSGSWNDITKSCNLETPTLNVRPTLSDPYVSSTKTVTDDTGKLFPATQFSMKCTLNYARQTVDNGARYDVHFQSNDQVVYTKTLKSTDAPVVEMSESNLVGRVGQNVTCKVASYWQSAYPTRSPYQVSDPYKFDIYFVDANNVNISRTGLAITESAPVKIYVKASFIFTTPWCFNLPAGSPCYPYYTFLLTSSNLLVSVCTFRLASDTQTSGQTSGEIWVSSIPDVSTSLGKTGNIYFQADSTDQVQNSIFGSFRSDAVPVSINDPRPWLSCDSSGDPHTRAFGKDYFYNMYITGEFVLLKVPSKKIEVHVKLYQCGSYVTCNCGVIAREGNNVLGVNSCGSSTLVERYLYDETNPGGTISSQGNSYIITLPSGLTITAYVSGQYMGIYVEGNGFDVYQGLCVSSLPTQCPNCECRDECSNTFGVSGTRSLFYYNRDNTPPCLDPKPPIVPQCDCHNGVSNRICTVPDNTGLVPPAPGKGKCSPSSNRRKRESSSVSEKPKFDQTAEQNSPNPQWPTKSGINESEANAACNSKITQSGVFNLCVIRLLVNVSYIIQQCVLDIKLTDDKELALKFVPKQMELICKTIIDTASNDINSALQEFVENACPGQCSQNGNCRNSQCTCKPGYISDDCSIQKDQVPVIQSLASPTCDVRISDVRTSETPCHEVKLYATHASTDQLVCQIRNATKVISLDIPESVSGGLVTCKLPLVPVNPGIAFGETKVSYTVYVSISNDAPAMKSGNEMKFSNEMKFAIYDGLCVTCDVSSGCQNTRTACNILDRCYENGTVMYCGNNHTDPRVCNPAVSNTKWLPINSADGSKGSTTCSSSRPAAATPILLFAYIFIRLVKEKYMQPN